MDKEPKLEEIEAFHTQDIKTSYRVYVYYESLKREIKTKKIYGYRCDERLIKLT